MKCYASRSSSFDNPRRTLKEALDTGLRDCSAHRLGVFGRYSHTSTPFAPVADLEFPQTKVPKEIRQV